MVLPVEMGARFERCIIWLAILNIESFEDSFDVMPLGNENISVGVSFDL